MRMNSSALIHLYIARTCQQQQSQQQDLATTSALKQRHQQQLMLRPNGNDA